MTHGSRARPALQGGGGRPAWRPGTSRPGRAGARGQPAGRRHPAGHLRRPGGEPAPRFRGPVDAAAGRRLLHDQLGRPRGQRRAGRGAAANRPGACCTTGPAGSTAPAPARCPASTRSGTCCSEWRRPRTSRSPAGGTRCSAGPSWPSSRRRRRSPRTCPARSASRWASAGRRSWGWPARGRATRWRWPRSATPRPATPPPSARSTPPATPPIRGSRSRCCWSARTTGSGSACPPRQDGWRRRSRPGRACSTWRPTAATRSRPTTRRPGRPAWSGPGGGRRSCTCRWSGSSATRAATRRRPTVRPLTWPRTSPVTRWSRPRPPWSAPAC